MSAEPTLRLDLGAADAAFAVAACLLPDTGALAAIERHWPGPALVCLTLRSAWDLYLTALDLPPGSHVLMTAITHPDMAAIVAAHGLVPIPVDVDPATMAPRPESLAAAHTPAARILLVAHLFGGRLDLAPIAAWCRQHGVLLVEDCAQVYGGGYLGSDLADAALFSFGPLKTGTALGGAVALIRDPGVRAAMAALQATYPRQGRREFLGRIAKYGLIGLVMRQPRLLALVMDLLSRTGREPTDVLRRLLRNAGSGFDLARFRRRPSLPLLRLLARRLARGPSPGARRRRAAGEALAKALEGVERPGRTASDHGHWIFPVVVESPEAVLEQLRRQRLYGMPGLSNLTAVLPPADRPDLMPVEALRITASAILLPLHDGLTGEAIGRIARVLKAAVGTGEAAVGGLHVR